MPIRLTTAEKKIAAKLAEIKKKSSSHSPSPAMLADIGVKITHDFCFLSNPHATELFLRYFRKDFKNEQKLRPLVEHYPSQNQALAQKLAESPLLKVGVFGDTSARALHSDAGGLFVGNGATEVIQAVLQNFAKKKILVPVPTFSPYLEFAPKGVKTVLHQLRKEAGFRLNLNELLLQVQREKPDTVVIINPNNPDGGYCFAYELQCVLKQLTHVPLVIVDESFIHFADKEIDSVAPLVKKYPNLVVIKSLSKDFGIAGLRLGYGVMSEKRVSALLERGYLWNVSGFGEYFLDLLNNKAFLREYEQARLRAIWERDNFFAQLSKIKGLKVYPSKANMFLVELLGGSRAEDLTVALLVRYGIYVRLCKDKVGLKGEFIRIASRKADENLKLVQAVQDILSE